MVTAAEHGGSRYRRCLHSTEPLTLRVEGTNTLEINDVLIGEVWLCSGQSNMEWTVDRSTNHDAEIATADYPLIRHIKIAKRSSTTPLDDIEADWTGLLAASCW